jgi:hypothetical protein
MVPTRVRISARVVAARRLPGCRRGAVATVVMTAATRYRADGRRLDSAGVRLPRSCRRGIVRFANGPGTVSVSVAAR